MYFNIVVCLLFNIIQLGLSLVTTFSNLNFEVASRMDSDVALLNTLNDPDVNFFVRNCY